MSELKVFFSQGALFGLAAVQSFLLLLYLGRVAAPEEVGEIGVVLGVVAIIVPWLDFAGTASGFRFSFEKEKFVPTREYFSLSMVLTTIVFFVFFVFLYLGTLIGGRFEFAITSLLFALTIAWASAINNQIAALLRARRYFKIIGLRAVLLSAITLMLFVAFDFLGFENYVIARLGLYFAALMILILPFSVRLIGNISLKNLRQYFTYIKPILPGAVLAASISASIGYSNRLVASFTQTPMETGVFVFATSVAAMGLMLNQIVNRLYQPLYFELSYNPVERLRDKLVQRIRISLFVSLIALSLLVLSFDIIFLLLEKAVYAPILSLGPMLVGAIALQLGYHIFSAKLHFEKRQSLLALIVSICAFLNFIFLYLGAHYYGLLGLSIASCLAALTQSLAVIVFGERKTIVMVLIFWLFVFLQICAVLFVHFFAAQSLWSMSIKLFISMAIIASYFVTVKLALPTKK